MESKVINPERNIVIKSGLEIGETKPTFLLHIYCCVNFKTWIAKLKMKDLCMIYINSRVYFLKSCSNCYLPFVLCIRYYCTLTVKAK